jgi:hypothetical protein
LHGTCDYSLSRPRLVELRIECMIDFLHCLMLVEMEWQLGWSGAARKHVTLKIGQLTMLFQDRYRPFTAVSEFRATDTQVFGLREDEMDGSSGPERIKDDGLTHYVFSSSSSSASSHSSLLRTRLSIAEPFGVFKPHQISYPPSQQIFEKVLEMANIFRFLSLLVISSSLALCTPHESPFFEAEKSLEQRNPVIVTGT